MELDDGIDLPRPPQPPPPFPPDPEQPSSGFFSGLLGTLSEAWRLSSDIRTEVDSAFTNSTIVTNIKHS